MNSIKLRSKFKEYELPASSKQNVSVVIPAVKGTPFLRYGEHAYYFFNFKTLKGFRITISHKDIILPGLERFFKANHKKYRFFPKLKSLFQKYHYDFNFLEQIMLMTVPHTVTQTKNTCFFINLWSYFGYIEIDCKNKTVTYKLLENDKNNCVLGSQQFYNSQTDELFYMAYSLKDSLNRIENSGQKVFCEISKYNDNSGKTKIWTGEFVDYIHDILFNKTRQYCVVCELGLYKDKNNNIIPSKVIVLDLKHSKTWIISRFIVAAHAQFDPVEPDIIYFSNHNFNFEHGSIYKVLWQASYNVNFRGPASIYKYRLTEDGPEEIRVFTRPDFYRLTNFHVFKHRDRTIIAATGSPDFIFIIDADSMEFIKKIEVNNPVTLRSLGRKIPCLIGTISPSPDGEKIFVHTNRSFQAVKVDSGEPEVILDHFFNHSCSNHMLTSTETNW